MNTEHQAPEGGDAPLVVKTAPARIWLQVSDDAEHNDKPFPASTHGDEVTWCQDQVLDCEVEYIRADLAAQPDARRAGLESLTRLDEEMRAPAEGDAALIAAAYLSAVGVPISDGHVTARRFGCALLAAERARQPQPKGTQKPVAEKCVVGQACDCADGSKVCPRAVVPQGQVTTQSPAPAQPEIGPDSENYAGDEAPLPADVPYPPSLDNVTIYNSYGPMSLDPTDGQPVEHYWDRAGLRDYGARCIAWAAAQSPAVKDEREQLRAAQAAAVMPLIGPLLDAWENADHDALEDQTELVKQMEAINFAMEHAGDESDVPVQGSQS